MEVISCEDLPGSSQTCLYLVRYEQHVVVNTHVVGGAKIPLRWDDYASFTLDRLDDKRRELVLAGQKSTAQGIQVSVRNGGKSRRRRAESLLVVAVAGGR